MFNEDVEHEDSDGLQHLRDALEKAERQVSSSTSDSEEERERKEEILDGFRAKLEEFEVETQKKVKITICSAVSGESIAQVRLRPTDFVVHLCEAVVKEMSHRAVVSHSIIFQSEAGCALCCSFLRALIATVFEVSAGLATAQDDQRGASVMSGCLEVASQDIFERSFCDLSGRIAGWRYRICGKSSSEVSDCIA